MKTAKQNNKELTGPCDPPAGYLFNEKSFNAFKKSAILYDLEQVITKAINAMKFAAFNYDGSKFENFDKSIIDSTGVSDTLYISVAELESLISKLNDIRK